MFLGPGPFNEYSHKLISNPLVYPAEAGLVLLFLVHAWKTITLTLVSSRARPVATQKKRRAGHTSRKSLASSTMILTGLFLLVFVPIHVWTFKYGAVLRGGERPASAISIAWSSRSSASPATSSSTSSA